MVFLDSFFYLDRFISGLVYLASVHSFVRFNGRVNHLVPENERLFVNLFIFFLFLGFFVIISDPIFVLV